MSGPERSMDRHRVWLREPLTHALKETSSRSTILKQRLISKVSIEVRGKSHSRNRLPRSVASTRPFR